MSKKGKPAPSGFPRPMTRAERQIVDAAGGPLRAGHVGTDEFGVPYLAWREDGGYGTCCPSVTVRALQEWWAA